MNKRNGVDEQEHDDYEFGNGAKRCDAQQFSAKVFSSVLVLGALVRVFPGLR